MSAPRLLHMGGAVVDFVYRAGGLPVAGGEVVAETFARTPGGGFNTMLAAARCGMPVSYGGRHGAGPQGDFLRAAFADAGIALLQPVDAAIDTGNCVVIVTPDGERSFLSWPGAEGRLAPADLAAVAPAAEDYVLVSGYTLSYRESREALGRFLESLDPAVAVVFDPSPVVASIPAGLLDLVLSRATWVSANAAEMAFLTRRVPPDEQVAKLTERCPDARGVVLRAGGDGAWIGLAGEGVHHIPAFDVEVHDTTGAGDTHLGAFIAALAQGRDPVAAAGFANAAAAVSVTRPGGACAPTREEIEAFMGAGGEPAG